MAKLRVYAPPAVELPDVGRLLSMPSAVVSALGERLRSAGLGPGFATRLARVGERLDDALRAPMRIWHARRMKDAAGVIGRLFVLHDPLETEEARAVLGDLAPLLEAGLVTEGPDGLTSRLHLAVFADAFCFGDLPGRSGDAVMPICGATMELVRAARPRAPVGGVLDLGCGAAPVAILLARVSTRVVATDVSPRALAFARLNLALHGIDNVELRLGDLYEPVRGERFDRVAAHPPFVARPAGAAASTFIHGGARGDELPLRVLAGAAEHLSKHGRAVVLGDWPVVEGDALEARVRTALGPGEADVMVLQSPPKNLDEYCAQLAAVEHAELGDGFRRAAIAHRDHLDALGVRALALACVVVQPGRGWTSLVPVRHVHDAPVTDDAVTRLLAARGLALGDRATLACARLRFAVGSRRVEQSMPDGAPPSLIVHPPAGAPEQPAALEGPLAAVVLRIAEAARVEEVGDAAIDSAREALLRGALVPA